MRRYIDADKLIEKIKSWMPTTNGALYDDDGNPTTENILASVIMEIDKEADNGPER